MADSLKPNQDEPDHLELLRRRLYKRNEEPLLTKRSKLFPRPDNTRRSWLEAVKPIGDKESRLSTKLLSRVLIASIIFFLVALGIAGFRFYRGSNLLSNDLIDVTIKGPVTVRAGDETILQVTIVNENKVTLTSADLVIEYPPGTRSPKNPREDLPRFRQMFGPLKPGETVTASAKALLFGEEGSEKSIKVGLEYRLPNSSAIYDKSKTYKLTIGSYPINIALDVPAELVTGEIVKAKIKATANSEKLLKNVLLNVAYPPGFQFQSASIKPSYGDNVWILGDLTAGTEREIEVTGVLMGQSDDVRAFRVTAGAQDEYDQSKIGVTYSDVFKTITVKQPFVAVDLAVNGDNSSSGQAIESQKKQRVDITWINNFTSRLADGQLTLQIIGGALDKKSVTVEQGTYRSSDNTLIWTKNDIAELASLEPGQRGRISFSFATLPLDQSLAQPELSFKLNFQGTRVSQAMAGEPVVTTLEKVVRVNSRPTIVAKALYSIGPIANTGPLPPKVDHETTYTIVWTVTNPANDLKGTKVRAYLPAYIKWKGNFVSADENLTYSTDSGEVIWDLGVVRSGTGFGSTAKREVSFQIGLEPSVSQISQQVMLIGDSKLSGIDTFTGANLTTGVNALDTNLAAEPGFKGDYAKVVD